MMAYPDLGLFIDNELRKAHGNSERRKVVNPATGESIADLPMASHADVDEAVRSAEVAFQGWRTWSAFDRYRLLRKAADCIRDDLEVISRVMTLEQGKPLYESIAEVSRTADVLDWFAEEGRRAYGRAIPSRQPDLEYVTVRKPVGVVAALTPWNYPAVIPIRKIGAALATGCTCVVKPAEETPGTLLLIAQCFARAGMPPGVLNVVLGDPAKVSEQLILSPEVRKVAFTGSTNIGKSVAGLAARGVKRATLELGGHAPVLIFDDADVEHAVATSIEAKFRNAGQVCTAPTRFYVHQDIASDFTNQFAEAATAIIVGDGSNPETVMGPLANSRRREAMAELVDEALQQGARLVAGGKHASNHGFFWRPTVLADVPESAKIMTEEPFGPIAIINKFETEQEATRKANRLPFGLAAYAFTRDLGRSSRVSNVLEAGMIGLNNYIINMPETPFGGQKESGYGSEGGAEGIEAYLNLTLISKS